MSFSKWEKQEDLVKNLNLKEYDGKEIDNSGIPFGYTDKGILLDTRKVHSLVIGGKGSGKHQGVVLPMLDSIVSSGESALVNDYSGETYELTHEMFESKGYNIINFDFDHAFNTNNWNPFYLASLYYKKGNIDLCQELVEDIGYYLLSEEANNSDPFWINSAINYFKGIAMYAIKNNDVVTINTIYDLNDTVRDNPSEFMKKINKGTSEYICLSSILNMPKETFLSVLSVFETKYNYFVVKENTNKMLSNNDIDFDKIFNEKTIIYIKSGEKMVSQSLLPLFISQIYNAKEGISKFNIIISDFSSYKPIQNFSKILDYSASKGLIFTILVPGFNVLEKAYGKEGRYLIEANVRNIIYLLSGDMATLEEISKLCGMKDKDNSLITIDELKTLEEFEAVIISVRCYPFKTKLLPYYKFKK